MTGDCHVRFCERRRARLPPATHQPRSYTALLVHSRRKRGAGQRQGRAASGQATVRAKGNGLLCSWVFRAVYPPRQPPVTLYWGPFERS